MTESQRHLYMVMNSVSQNANTKDKGQSGPKQQMGTAQNAKMISARNSY